MNLFISSYSRRICMLYVSLFISYFLEVFIINQLEYLTICDSKFLIPGIYICTFSETQQKFNGGYRSWGSFFVNLSDFYDSKQGYLLNDTCIIEAHVCFSDLSTLEANNLKKITPTKDSKSGDQAARNSESTQQEDDKEAETEIETEISDESETFSSSTCGSSETEWEIQSSDLTLKDLLDLASLGKEEAACVPLLEEACIWHPSLIRSQRKSSRWFKLWAFTSLGQVLHLLKTSKVKDMNEDACNRLQGLWEELVKHSGFQLSWLEPYVQSALDMKTHLDKTDEVNKLKDSVVALEIKMKKLREELVAAEAEFEEFWMGLESEFYLFWICFG